MLSNDAWRLDPQIPGQSGQEPGRGGGQERALAGELLDQGSAIAGLEAQPRATSKDPHQAIGDGARLAVARQQVGGGEVAGELEETGAAAAPADRGRRGRSGGEGGFESLAARGLALEEDAVEQQLDPDVSGGEGAPASDPARP